MKDTEKMELIKRNERIVQAVVKKIEKVCPGAVALIGIAGSFHSGDFYEKSDLDLCIVISDERAWKIASCFILGDVAFDLYCTPWSKLEEMAEYRRNYDRLGIQIRRYQDFDEFESMYLE